MTETDFLSRIALSVLLGFLIGLERQLKGHPSGLRTNVLVCLGSTFFSLFPRLIEGGDITRTSAQIVTGVGFLCSAIIFRNGGNVRGLGTAATIWCTAAVGVLVSVDNPRFAVMSAVALIACNLLFKPLAVHLRPLGYFDETERLYRISVVCLEEKDFAIRASIMEAAQSKYLTLIQLETQMPESGRVEIEATFSCDGARQNDIMERLVGRIGVEEGVLSARWELLADLSAQ